MFLRMGSNWTERIGYRSRWRGIEPGLGITNQMYVGDVLEVFEIIIRHWNGLCEVIHDRLPRLFARSASTWVNRE